jgi:sulfur-oxidizing protein SoxY
MRRLWKSTAVSLLGSVLVIGGAGVAWAQAELATEQWQEWRAKLFGDRPIREDTSGVFELDVPLRPDNGGAVPVAIKIAHAPERFVKRVVVVIDKNPEPLAAIFDLTRDTGRATVETEMRVETHSPVRAIVETSDGQLFMAARFVKAAGGCSAVPVMDATAAAAAARLGQVQVRLADRVVPNEPNRVQVIVNHPNYTGFQVHPLKMFPISAHYVTNVNVSYAGAPIFTAQTTIANSEDPNFRFSFAPSGPGALAVEVKDSRGQVFTKRVDVAPTSR